MTRSDCIPSTTTRCLRCFRKLEIHNQILSSMPSRQKYNSDKLEMVQRRAARFVKGRYGMFESVPQMLEQLTWTPLSKRRENSRLILFYKIINNLAVVPHSCLEKADVRTRKKHSQKFRHIGYNIDPYGQLFFPNCISAWNGLAKDIAEANTLLQNYNTKLQN